MSERKYAFPLCRRGKPFPSAEKSTVSKEKSKPAKGERFKPEQKENQRDTEHGRDDQ